MEFRNQHHRGKVKQATASSRWIAPTKLKMNINGAFSENGAGISVAVRDHQGPVEALMVERIDDATNAKHVECLAFFKALQFAKDYGITHFIMEGDAL